MRKLNWKGKVCFTAFWMMPVTFIVSLLCCLLRQPEAMCFWGAVFWLSAVIYLILIPQKYVDPEDRLFKKP